MEPEPVTPCGGNENPKGILVGSCSGFAWPYVFSHHGSVCRNRHQKGRADHGTVRLNLQQSWKRSRYVTSSLWITNHGDNITSKWLSRRPIQLLNFGRWWVHSKRRDFIFLYLLRKRCGTCSLFFKVRRVGRRRKYCDRGLRALSRVVHRKQ